jgi:hypothetical protein
LTATQPRGFLPPVSRFLRSAPRSALALGAVVAVVTTGALASLGAGDDRSAAEAAIKNLTAIPAHAKLANEPLTRATNSLRRAADARVAGDHAHGARLEGVGREWAETGRDLVRAAEAERQAHELYSKAAALETKAVRGRALLEETMARRERAREKLQQLEPKPEEKPSEKAAADKPAPAKPAPEKPTPGKPTPGKLAPGKSAPEKPAP